MSKATLLTAAILLVVFAGAWTKKRNIKDEAEELVDRLREITITEIDNARVVISELNLKMQSSINKEYEEVQAKITEMYESLSNDLKMLEESMGLPATECILQNLSTIEGLPGVIMGHHIDCMTNHKHVADLKLKELMDAISKNADQILILEDTLSKCDNTECYSAVALHAAELISFIPTNVMEQLNEARSIEASMSLELNTCSRDQIKYMEKKQQEIIDYIIECASLPPVKSTSNV